VDECAVRDLARRYTEAWCSQDPVRVAAHYQPGGMIAINDGEPAPIEGVARAFIEAFPDIQVYMDDLVFADDAAEYRWTFTGTSSETGKWVRISGVETWTIGEDGLIAASKGAYDQAEYDRQLEQGAPDDFVPGPS
jgi:nuclear transport factor 2 (NTF2) superfamily protein